MRKIIVKITLTIFIVTLFGCSKQFRFDSNFIEHFPKNKQNEVLYYEHSMKLPNEFKQYGAHKKEAYLYAGSIKAHVDTLINNAKSKVQYNDSCVLILPLRYHKNIDIGKPIINDCFGNSITVLPNMQEIRDFLSIKLSDFEFYVLQNEVGKFLDEEDLFNELIMPKEWENGYSKGVAINKKENLVVFWINLW